MPASPLTTGMNSVAGMFAPSNVAFDYGRYDRYKPGPTTNPTGPYFDPTHSYGSPFGPRRNNENSFADTPWGGYMTEQNPEAWYNRSLGQMGVGQQAGTLMNRFFKNQFGDVMSGYEQALLTNPFLTFRKHMQGLGGEQDWLNRWKMATPQARGEQLGLAQGPQRWQVW